MANSAIVGLAFVKVNWDYLKRDYIENFVPLIVECLRVTDTDLVSLSELKANIEKHFGLDLPLNSVKTILHRASKRKYVERKHGLYYVNRQQCDSLEFDEARKRVTAIQSRVSNKLREYVSREHGREWSEEKTDHVIYEFLSDNTISLIFSLAEDSSLHDRSGQPSSEAYIVGSFLDDMKLSDPECFRDFEVLVQGNLLANALYLPDPGKIAKRFRGTRVYLDSSILVFAGGFAGTERALPAVELIELLSEYGARLCCFVGTVNEVRGILDACGHRMRQGNLQDSYGPSMEYFIESGKTASDIELMSARLPQKLKEMGLRIDEKPPYDHEYQIDEAGLDAALEEFVGYKNPKARVHDVDCISAIARIRRGQEVFALEDTKALFITRNTNLAKGTRIFFQSESPPGAVALCLPNFGLANLLWLKNPTKAPNLPRKQLLAQSYAAIRPSEQLWKRYLIEIAKLQEDGEISIDQYYLLRHRLSMKSALMELTEGDEQAFAEGTVQELVNIAIENAQFPVKKQLEKEKVKRLSTEAELERIRSDELARRQRVRNVCNVLARHLRNALLGVSIIGIVIASLYTFPWSLPTPQSNWFSYGLSFVLILLFLIGICNLVWGTSISDLLDRVEQYTSDKLRGIVSAIFFGADIDD